ncbi:hypothetical protein PGT21_026155 [Puccinia graminis f. sp. tritici]|uniref:Uncharacterized protein n=1 Tax=Puccinia graminis f. sp. tritici TaxID=56615 RepID=A0A5B0QNK6_PUCGR|nr:hypothetical protein PGT21_026155 [Puccinia graminis f. sp. tritici]
MLPLPPMGGPAENNLALNDYLLKQRRHRTNATEDLASTLKDSFAGGSTTWLVIWGKGTRKTTILLAADIVPRTQEQEARNKLVA